MAGRRGEEDAEEEEEEEDMGGGMAIIAEVRRAVWEEWEGRSEIMSLRKATRRGQRTIER